MLASARRRRPRRLKPSRPTPRRQVAAAERVLEVWLQLAGEMGAPPAQLADIRRAAPGAGGGLLGTAPQG
jgi:hypothetical protein